MTLQFMKPVIHSGTRNVRRLPVVTYKCTLHAPVYSQGTYNARVLFFFSTGREHTLGCYTFPG